MKKRISGIVIVILIAASLSMFFGTWMSTHVYADEEASRFCDYADLLNTDEGIKIADLLNKISNEKDFDIVIVTTYGLYADDEMMEFREQSYNYSSEMEFADDFYDYNNYGFGEDRDGVLLLVNMENNKFWISTTGYGIKAINDETREEIQKKFTPYLKNGDYYKAFEKFAEECGSAVSHARFKNLLIHIGATLFIAIVVASIVCGSMKAKLKSVRSQAAAGNYVVTDSMHLTNQSEMFLYSIVNRVAKPKDNGGGSSTHTSSSGTSHGGGGGSF